MICKSFSVLVSFFKKEKPVKPPKSTPVNSQLLPSLSTKVNGAILLLLMSQFGLLELVKLQLLSKHKIPIKKFVNGSTRTSPPKLHKPLEFSMVVQPMPLTANL